MPRMAPSAKIILAVTDEMREALDAYCERHGIALSDLMRDAVLKQIGRKDLIGTMPGRGKPRKDAGD